MYYLWRSRFALCHTASWCIYSFCIQGISDAYYCAECTRLEKDRDGCPKIVNLGASRTDLFYERRRLGKSVQRSILKYIIYPSAGFKKGWVFRGNALYFVHTHTMKKTPQRLTYHFRFKKVVSFIFQNSETIIPRYNTYGFLLSISQNL